MAEVLAHPGMGIGEKMSWARINIETADLLAWSFMVVIITFIIMGVLKLFQKEKN
jgi:ABC-type nitrate/sulfonate/bicarbonate transport system permease component